MNRSFSLPALGAVFLSLAACDSAEPAASQGRDVAPQRAPEQASPHAAKPSTLRVKPSVSERLVEKTVAWPAASEVDAPGRARFAATDLERVDASGVPVLSPLHGLEAREPAGTGASRFARATVVAKADWFTLAVKDADFEAQRLAGRAPGAKGAGISVFVQGQRLARRLDNVPPTLGRHQVRGRPAWITQNEGIWSATWEEHNVTYAVELECGDPDDARCASDAHLRELAESLVFVGGRGALATSGGAK